MGICRHETINPGKTDKIFVKLQKPDKIRINFHELNPGTDGPNSRFHPFEVSKLVKTITYSVSG